MRVFLAGATGAVGKRLVPQLVARGHQVTGTTRTADTADLVRAMGAEAAVVDGLDAIGIGAAVARAEPVRSVINPDKLRHLGEVADVRALLREGRHDKEA